MFAVVVPLMMLLIPVLMRPVGSLAATLPVMIMQPRRSLGNGSQSFDCSIRISVRANST